MIVRDAVHSGGTVALVRLMPRTIRDWATTATREGLDMNMTQRARLNQVSTVGLIVFSWTAFTVVLPLWYGMVTGHLPPPAGDEGAAAHIFQLLRRCSRRASSFSSPPIGRNPSTACVVWRSPA